MWERLERDGATRMCLTAAFVVVVCSRMVRVVPSSSRGVLWHHRRNSQVKRSNNHGFQLEWVCRVIEDRERCSWRGKNEKESCWVAGMDSGVLVSRCRRTSCSRRWWYMRTTCGRVMRWVWCGKSSGRSAQEDTMGMGTPLV